MKLTLRHYFDSHNHSPLKSRFALVDENEHVWLDTGSIQLVKQQADNFGFVVPHSIARNQQFSLSLKPA